MRGLCLWLFLLGGLGIQAAGRPLILISFDGFRWDYCDRGETPNIQALMAGGFKVKRLIPAYPSITFPNHYSLVTGMMPARHGLTGNVMYDAASGKSYDKAVPEGVVRSGWYSAENIWDVTRRAGIQAAVYFWVGSEIEGRQPDFFHAYNGKTTVEEKLAQLSDWLMADIQPNPRFISLYFEMLDKQGHSHGPDSPQLTRALHQVDEVIGRVAELMRKSGREPNLLVVSDHGMTNMNGEILTLPVLREAVGEENIAALVNNYSQVDLFLKNPDPDRIADILARLPKGPFIHWYKRADHPEPLHPTRNGDIVGLMAPGGQFLEAREDAYLKGGHGYASDVPAMAATCFGIGPAFRAGTVLASVRTVDVFPLLLHLLELEQRPVDGRLDVWLPALMPEAPKPAPARESFWLIIAVVGVFLSHVVRRLTPLLLGMREKTLPFSWPWVELVGGIAFALLALVRGHQPDQWMWYLFALLLLAITAADYLSKYIPTLLCYLGVLAGVALNAAFPHDIAGFFEQAALTANLGVLGDNLHLSAAALSLAGGLVGFLQMEFIRRVFRPLVNMDVMGRGDALLMMMVGAFLGPKMVVLALLPACFVGVITGVVWKMLFKIPHFPFGPSLAMGSFLILPWGRGMFGAFAAFQRSLYQMPPIVLLVFSLGLLTLLFFLIFRLKKRASMYKQMIEDDYQDINRKMKK